MALKLYDKLTPSGEFALVDSADVEMSDGSRLEAFLEAMLVRSGNVVMSDDTLLEAYLAAMVSSFQVEVDYENDVAFDTGELVVGQYEDIYYPSVPDDSDDSDDSEDTENAGENTPAILGVAILGRTILGQY